MSLFALPTGGRLAVAVLAISTVFSNCSGCGSSNPSTVSAPTTETIAPASHAAAQADAFTDSVGINTHYGSPNYSQAQFSAINSLLTSLGLRHARDSSYPSGQLSAVCANDAAVGAQGVHFDFITSIGMTASDVRAWLACSGSAADAYEPYNEYDITHPSSDPNWPATLDTWQQTLYATIKQNPSSTGVTVLAPSLTSSDAANSVGSLTQYLDYGNLHAYFAGFQPETTGYGANGFGSLSFNQALGATVAGAKPSYVTETGYSTSVATNTVDNATQMKYSGRALFFTFANGIQRTYLYELVDEPNTFPQTFANSGLVDANLVTKPAFNEVHGILSTVADPGPAFSTTPATFGLTGQISNVDYALLQKRSGEYDLAIWIAAQSYDPNKLTPITVPSQSLSVTFPKAVTTASLVSFDGSGTPQNQPLGAGTSVSFTVTDNVEILKFK